MGWPFFTHNGLNVDSKEDSLLILGMKKPALENPKPAFLLKLKCCLLFLKLKCCLLFHAVAV